MSVSILTGQPHKAACVAVQMDHRDELDVDHVAFVGVEDDPPQLIEGSL